MQLLKKNQASLVEISTRLEENSRMEENSRRLESKVGDQLEVLLFRMDQMAKTRGKVAIGDEASS